MAYGKNCRQGKFKPKNPQKYKGDSTNIVYRSGWELIAFKYMDLHDHIVSWASEEVVVPYMSPVDGKRHRYFIDLYFQTRDADGNIKTYLAEIKPKKFTEPPKEPKKKTPTYVREVAQYVVNRAKWDAAEEVCKDNGISFIILTEDELGIS